jgi:membrane protein
MTNMAQARPDPGARGAETPLADLVKQLSEQASRLARLEVDLAKAEVREKGRQAGRGAGLLAGAGIVELLAAGVLVACVVLALATAMAAWLAALIVGAALVIAGGVLGLAGRNRLRRATPLAPEESTESVKEDMQWAKTSATSARR